LVYILSICSNFSQQFNPTYAHLWQNLLYMPCLCIYLPADDLAVVETCSRNITDSWLFIPDFAVCCIKCCIINLLRGILITLIFTVYLHVTVLHTACLLKNKSTHCVTEFYFQHFKPVLLNPTCIFSTSIPTYRQFVLLYVVCCIF
jgi:hypothetical protein